MIIIGAKGFAKEVLEILHQNGETENLCFYDDVNAETPDLLYERYPVLKNMQQVQQHFSEVSNRFSIGIGNPALRFKLFEKFSEMGGEFSSTISCHCEIGSFGVTIENGCNILGGVKISNDVEIAEGTMVYYNSIITHDVKVGRFAEISPDVKLLGRCQIGNFVQIGSGSIIFPDVVIGDYAVIAAGSVVRKNVPPKVMVAGIPAVIKKEL